MKPVGYGFSISLIVVLFEIFYINPKVTDPFQASLLVFLGLIAMTLAWIEVEFEYLNKRK